MTLRPGHHGYAYQDVLTGNALVELMLGTATMVLVDLKEFDGDRFDDITITLSNGRRVRLQIKHTTVDRELSRATFTRDDRNLRLDVLMNSLLEDLNTHPDTTYRVVVRDGRPADDLAVVLTPINPADDPGDPLPGIGTTRYKFDVDKLQQFEPWKTLLASIADLDVRRAADRLIVDTRAPAASLSFAEPGPVEVALLTRAREELGAGRPPNAQRTAEDVARALLGAATKARATKGDVTRAEVARDLKLTTDFGAVSDGHPVEPAVQVVREGAAKTLGASIESAAVVGGRVVLVGEPGAGKTWLSQQVADGHTADGWTVVRHHCWLGETDSDRKSRVLVEVVIGSLLNQLEVLAPDAVMGIRPRFAATAEALESALAAFHAKHEGERLLLIVDGLDHIDRVLGRHVGGSDVLDPGRAVVEELSNVALPEGVCLLLASQPGSQLDSAAPASGAPLEMPRMSFDELGALAERHHVLEDPVTGDPVDERDRNTIVGLLDERSNGNALYATYLCRHATGASPLGDVGAAPTTVAEVTARLDSVPASASDLDSYYTHLLDSLTPDEHLAIGALAVCDFALSKSELGEVLPAVEPLLEHALSTLAPVLTVVPGLGGLKVHHESFSRYIRRDKSQTWADSIRRSAVAWLRGRGFFNDTRAFRNLPQLLADLGDYDELKALVDPQFVSNALTYLQPPEAIKQVLGIVSAEARDQRDWTTLITCLEARRAVSVYEHESLADTLVEYADVVVAVLGADTVAERLVYEGRATFAARWGLSLCHAVDTAGGAAPWEAYLAARQRESKTDNTHYGDESDRRVYLAEQLGQLRMRADDLSSFSVAEAAERLDGYSERMALAELVEILASAVPADILLDTARAMTNANNAAEVFLALADLSAYGVPGFPEPVELAREAAARAPRTHLSEYLDNGIPGAEVIAGLGTFDLPAEFLAVTQTAALEQGMSERPGRLRRWLDLLHLAHATDPGLPLSVLTELGGDNFFLAFLRFAVGTVGLDEDVASGTTAPEDASVTVRVALEELASHAHHRGAPRTVDLSSIHPLIHEVLERALLVVRPEELNVVFEQLTVIGNATTWSLSGMAETGPLATNDLLGILSRVSDRIGTDPIHRLLAAIRDARDDVETMYSVMADYEAATARICLQAGALDEAVQHWKQSAVLLCTYGGHKDSTIYEFIESIEDLATIDLDEARAALARLQDAAYLVLQHTDTRGTNGVPAAWWEQAADIDPIAAASDSAATLIDEYGFEHYLADAAQARLLANLSSTGDPVALAALRLTVGMDWRQPGTDLELAARLHAELGVSATGDTALAVFASTVGATYDNQAAMYARDTPKTTASPELVSAIRALGGPAFAAREPGEETDGSSSRSGSNVADPDELKKVLVALQRPQLPEGAAGVAAAIRDYQEKDYRSDPLSPRFDVDALVNAVGWRVLEATAAGGAEAGKQLLDLAVRELNLFGHEELFASVADGLAARCDGTITDLDQVASYCYAVAFIRIRGGGGYQTFAGRERVALWANAYNLDQDTAVHALASAIANNIATERQGIFGIVQAVVAAFAVQPAPGTGGTAVEVWNTAFGGLEPRIPGPAGRRHPPYVPSTTPDNTDRLNEALATLAVAGIGRPKREDIRSALLALTFLIACRPELAQAAALPVLASNVDAGRKTWVLETIRDHLRGVELTDPFVEQLTDLTRADLLAVRSLARQILEGNGLPVPGLPATAADSILRNAIHEGLADR